MPLSLTWLKKQKLPLFWLLTIPFTGLTIVGMGLMYFLSIQHSRAVAFEAATLLTEQVSFNIRVQLRDYLKTPHVLQQTYIQTFQQGLVDVNDLDQMLNFFSRQSQFLEPTIGTIAFANLEGEFVGANDSEEYLVLANRQIDRSIRRYSIKNDRQPGSIISESFDYDARQRNWYQTAIEAGKPTFTEIEASITRKRLDVTAVSPYFDAEGILQGVFLTDLSLENISQFLAGLNIAKTGLAFITERNGFLVAKSTSDLPFRSLPNEEPERLAAEDSSNSLIRVAAKTLQEKCDDFWAIEKQVHTTIELQGKRYILHSTSLQNDEGIDWLISVVIPEKDFLGQVEVYRVKNLFVSMLIAGTVIVVGIVMARTYTRPLLVLSRVSEEIAAGNLNQVVPLPLSREVQTLAASFQQMTEKLTISFATLEKRVEERTVELAQLNQELTRLARTDSLTQTGNRGYFDSQIKLIWKDALQTQKNICLIICDIDYFKRFNNTYGHVQGDRCIKQVAQVLLDSAQSFEGVVCRYGGEEFTITLKGWAALKAEDLVHRIQRTLQENPIPYDVSDEKQVTLSLGIATVQPSAEKTIQGLINSADQALYRAKAEGRNRYCIHENKSLT